MLDANGRPVEVGDTVAMPYDNGDMARLPKAISDAVLGVVLELFTEFECYRIVGADGEVIAETTDKAQALNLLNLWGPLRKAKGQQVERGYIHLGDGITYPTAEIVTLSGLEFVTCEECNFTWPFDVRMNDSEECPGCGALLYK